MNRICCRNFTDVSAIHKIGHGWCDLSVEGLNPLVIIGAKSIIWIRTVYFIVVLVLTESFRTPVHGFLSTASRKSFLLRGHLRQIRSQKKKSSPLNPSKILKCYLVWTSVRVSIMLFDIFAAAVVFPSHKTAYKMHIGTYYSSFVNYEDIYIYTSAHQK